jgi:hypothetical protein
MFNDFKGGDLVWVNNRLAKVTEAVPSMFGKDYKIMYLDDQEPKIDTVMGMYALSYEKAVEMGLCKTVEDNKKEKPKKDFGDFVVGKYMPCEIGFNGLRFAVADMEKCQAIKDLDPMLQVSLAMACENNWQFWNDGTYAQKNGNAHDFELKDGKFVLSWQQDDKVQLFYKGGFVVQKYEMPNVGNIEIYFRKENE